MHIKLLSSIFILMIGLHCEAGNVLWGNVESWHTDDQAVLDGKSYSGYDIIYWNFFNADPKTPFYVSAEIGMDVARGNITLKALANHVLYWGTTLVLMDIGDVVDYNSTVGADEVFYSFYCKDGGKSEETLSDYDVVLPRLAEQIVYFGFATNITPYDEPSFLYGWLGLTVTADSLSVNDAVINLYGGPMTVGLIPEPTAAALMLLGLAPLALRRRLAASMCAIQECG